MNVFCEQGENLTIITLEGPLVVPESEEFKTFVIKRIDGDSTEILIDLTNVNYVDSSGFSVLLTLLQAARQRGGDVRLAGTSKSVKETIKHIGLHHVFQQFDTLEDGIESFKSVESD